MVKRDITTRPGRPIDWGLVSRIWIPLLPALALLALLMVWPMIVMLEMSFRSYFPGDFYYTVAKYSALVLDPFVLQTMLRSFALGAVTTLGCLILGFPAAWFLARGTSRYKHLVFLGVIFPLLVSVVVRTMGWMVILGSEGLLNNLMVALHIIKEPINLMRSFWTVVVGMVHVLLPFMVLSISSVLGKIDNSYVEAAHTLGANRTIAFFRVIVPLSVQGIVAGSIIVFCLSVGAYITPAWLGRGSVQVLATTITQQMTVAVDWPSGSAMSMILVLTTLVLLAVNIPLVRKYGMR